MSHTSASWLMTAEEAEQIGGQALLFLVADDDRFAGLSAATGLMPDDLARDGRSAHCLAAVFDYLLADERLLLEFAAANGVAPERLMAVSHVLAERAAGRSGEAARRSKRFEPLDPLRRT